MNNRWLKIIQSFRRPGALLILIVLIFGLSYSFAQTHPFLKYFPTNETIITFSTDGLSGYPLDLHQVTNCNPPSFGGADVIQASTDCRTCMVWKGTCADCCIDASTADYFCAASPTAPGISGGYNPVPFSENCDGAGRVSCVVCNPGSGLCGPDPIFEQCDAASISNIPHCQRSGCPNSDDFSNANCVTVGTAPNEEIYCTGPNKIPLDRGCVPLAAAQAVVDLGYDPIFHSSSATGSDFYTITTYPASTFSDTDPVPVAFDNAGISFDPDSDPCYQYEPGAFSAYVDSCRIYADAAETGVKDNHCCQAGVCGGVGMVEGCVTDVDDPLTLDDETGGCENILNHWGDLITVSPGVSKNCHAIQPHECVALGELVSNCIQSSDPAECSACFVEIDSDFRYEFVPKSGESLIILWLIEATPKVPAGMSPFFRTYFYSQIKVYEQDGSPLGLPSDIVHQKNFIDAFSLYSAMSVDSSMLEAGKKYEVRMSYFIPNDSNIPPGENLTMTVNRMEMNIFRVRE